MRSSCLYCLLAIGMTQGLACGDDVEEEELPDVECSGTVPDYEDVAAFDKCTTCHSTEHSGTARNDAPEDVNFNTESAAKAHAEEAAHEVYEGEMPPKNSGLELTESEKTDLYKWALCP